MSELPGPAHLLTIVALVFVSSAVCTGLVRAAARHNGWLAPPRPDRWHREPTALFGGVGIFAAFITGIAAVVPWSVASAGLIGLTTVMFCDRACSTTPAS